MSLAGPSLAAWDLLKSQMSDVKHAIRDWSSGLRKMYILFNYAVGFWFSEIPIIQVWRSLNSWPLPAGVALIPRAAVANLTAGNYKRTQCQKSLHLFRDLQSLVALRYDARNVIDSLQPDCLRDVTEP